MIFAHPYLLLLLGFVPVLIWLYRRASRHRHVTLQVSRLDAMRGGKTWVVVARNWIQGLRWLVLVLLLVAAARPQLSWQEQKVSREAVELMLVLDVSPSMLTRDFDPDRLEVSKKLALDLLGRRPGDRFGLVLVAGGAFTQCPLTDDHRLVRAFIANARVGKLPEGTDLGSGISTAVNQLKDSKVRGKGIVVITDGGDNMGALRPRAAAAIARTLGVNVFVVGLGRNGVALAPTRARGATRYEFAERHHDFDETGLKTIAEEGEGDYFRVETGRDLAEISQQIQALEKSTVETTLLVRKLDLYFWFLTAALCLLLLEMLLRWGPLRVITV